MCFSFLHSTAKYFKLASMAVYSWLCVKALPHSIVISIILIASDICIY